MVSTESIYSGANNWFDSSYGLSNDYGESFLNMDYRPSTSNIGITSDARSANQLAAVSKQIFTGVKTIEVGGVQMGQLDYIPKQQFKEINRLKKLTGVDLTFHGPIVEPTGIVRRGWQESDREQVEKQLSSAVIRSHDLDPDGNVVVTIHASAAAIEPETYIINEKGKKELREFMVFDESTGDFSNIGKQLDYIKGETKMDPYKIIAKRNEDQWFRELQHINFNTGAGSNSIKRIINDVANKITDDIPTEEDKEKVEKDIMHAYKLYRSGKSEQILKDVEFLGKGIKEGVRETLDEVTHGDIYLRESYVEFQNLFNKAYKAAEINKKKDDLKKLNALRDRLAPKIREIEKDNSKVMLLADELTNGVNVLRDISVPQTLKHMKDWTLDKSSTTFSNVAFDAYKKFKNSAPIISIENPPVGTGLSTGEDLRTLVKESQDKFVERAQKDLNMSKSEATKQAKKLIGVTWDVGHINMLRGRGYEEKHLIEETKKVAPYVKHVHLSDNFGLEHTELPMGMGNVPTKKHLELIGKFNKKAKQIVETGGWYEHFKTPPLRETFRALGSPVFGEGEGPYWNQIADTSAGYFVGQGAINPQVHHSMYGSGWSNLPVELGGQSAGQSRVSGAPIE